MFNTIENKQMILSLLNEQTNGQVHNNQLFIQHFNNTIIQIERNKKNYKNIMEMNKILLAHSHNILSNLRQPKIQPKKVNFFEKKLKDKQNELKLMKDGGHKPKNIDFSLKNNETFGNVNRLMNNTEKKRVKDLENIKYTTSQDEAIKWLQNENPTNIGPVAQNEKPPKLIIQEYKAPPIQNKKVSFNLNQKKTNICVKISYTENGANKTMICSLSSGFRIFMSPHGQIEEKANIILENVEMFTN